MPQCPTSCSDDDIYEGPWPSSSAPVDAPSAAGLHGACAWRSSHACPCFTLVLVPSLFACGFSIPHRRDRALLRYLDSGPRRSLAWRSAARAPQQIRRDDGANDAGLRSSRCRIRFVHHHLLHLPPPSSTHQQPTASKPCHCHRPIRSFLRRRCHHYHHLPQPPHPPPSP